MILHIPHSSKVIPKEHLSDYKCTPLELQGVIDRITDTNTDELFQHWNTVRVVFPYSRVFVM